MMALLLCAPAWTPGQPPRWETNLAQDYRLQNFDRQATAAWMSQQGVLFLTPEKILLYQANRTREFAKLGPRGASGGAGNFLLNINGFYAPWTCPPAAPIPKSWPRAAAAL